MAIPRTDRGPLSHASTSGTGQTATSSPFTPTQGRVLVVAGAILTGNNSADLNVTDTFGAAVGPWTVIKTDVAIAYTVPSTRAFVAWAYVSGSPGSGTVSVVRTNSGSTECFIGATVLEFSDIDPSPVRQYVTNQSSGGGSTISVNLPSAPLSSGHIVGVASDFWGTPTQPSSAATLDLLDSYPTGIIHRGAIRTVEDSTPTQNYSFGGLNGDASAAVMVELWVPQSQDASPDAAPATGSGVAHDATGSVAVSAQAGAAEGSGQAYDATIHTISNTPRPDAAEGRGAAVNAKIKVAPNAGTAAGVGTAPNATAATHVRAFADVALGEGVAFNTIGDSIEPPIVIPVSDDDLLELNVTQRREAFRFDVLDSQGNVIGTVHPEVPVKIDNKTDSNIKRRLSGFRLAAHEVNDIDVLSHRIRPVMVLQNGSEYPLGVFLFADASHPRFSYGRELDATLVDHGLVLGQPLQQTVSFEQGHSVVDAMAEVFDLAGITNYVIDTSHAEIGSAVAWPAGKSDTYLKVLNDLAALAGFYSPYFDNNGVARARVAIDLDTASPTLRYDDDGRIIAGSIVEANDALSAPNRYIVVDTSATINPVVAVYDLPSSAPHSIARRGFAIPRFVEAPGVGNTDQALALAVSTAQTENRTFETIHFQSPTDPRHDTFDAITFRGNTYMELAWSITCVPGGPMEHTINRVYLNE